MPTERDLVDKELAAIALELADIEPRQSLHRRIMARLVSPEHPGYEREENGFTELETRRTRLELRRDILLDIRKDLPEPESEPEPEPEELAPAASPPQASQKPIQPTETLALHAPIEPDPDRPQSFVIRSSSGRAVVRFWNERGSAPSHKDGKTLIKFDHWIFRAEGPEGSREGRAVTKEEAQARALAAATSLWDLKPET